MCDYYSLSDTIFCLVFVIFEFFRKVMFIFWIYCATTLSTLTYKLFVIDCGNLAAWGCVIYTLENEIHGILEYIGMRYIYIYYTFRSDFSFEIVSFQNCVALFHMGIKFEHVFFLFSRFYSIELNNVM